MWIDISAHQPQREEVYLTYSPRRGYETQMWENKPLHRVGHWDGVTHWMPFEKMGTK